MRIVIVSAVTGDMKRQGIMADQVIGLDDDVWIWRGIVDCMVGSVACPRHTRLVRPLSESLILLPAH
jgi:hypothetical protein